MKNTDSLKFIKFFSSISNEGYEILDTSPKMTFKKGEFLMKKGDDGNGMFFIKKGTVSVTDGKTLNKPLKEGDFVGEISLITAPEKRSASVFVTSDKLEAIFVSVEIFENLKKALNPEIKKEILSRIKENYENSQPRKVEISTEYLKSVPFFSTLNEEGIESVKKGFISKVFNKGDFLIKEGDKGEGMYIISFGEVEVKKGENLIATLGSGSFAGEMSLVNDKARSADVVVSSSKAGTIFLSADAFEKIKENLPRSIQEEMAKRIEGNKIVNEMTPDEECISCSGSCPNGFFSWIKSLFSK